MQVIKLQEKRSGGWNQDTADLRIWCTVFPGYSPEQQQKHPSFQSLFQQYCLQHSELIAAFSVHKTEPLVKTCTRKLATLTFRILAPFCGLTNSLRNISTETDQLETIRHNMATCFTGAIY